MVLCPDNEHYALTENHQMPVRLLFDKFFLDLPPTPLKKEARKIKKKYIYSRTTNLQIRHYTKHALKAIIKVLMIFYNVISMT